MILEVPINFRNNSCINHFLYDFKTIFIKLFELNEKFNNQVKYIKFLNSLQLFDIIQLKYKVFRSNRLLNSLQKTVFGFFNLNSKKDNYLNLIKSKQNDQNKCY
jgi:hypothetical protein